MRCELTGASFAVYWANVRGELKPINEYATDARRAEMREIGITKGLHEALKPVDALGASAIATVQRDQTPAFASNALRLDLLDKDVVVRYGIHSVSLEPYQSGVIMYGTSRSQGAWVTAPQPPAIPVDEMRKAFEDLGALYAIFWAKDADGRIRSQASYENPMRAQYTERIRGDGDTFLSRTNALSCAPDGIGPVATCMRDKSEIVVVAGDDGTVTATIDGDTHQPSRLVESPGLQRRASDISEFGIRSMHLLRVEGGVLEYGISGNTILADVPLRATVELECEAAGASYAIYWKESLDKKTAVGGSFSTPHFRDEAARLGFSMTYAEASEAFTAPIDAADGPVAQIFKTRKPIFIKDVASHPDTFNRRDLALAHNVKSIVFRPVLGGVIEMGVSGASPTFGTAREWASVDDALANKIPNLELENAFSKRGATYAIFWRRNWDTGKYEVAANYETLTNALNRRALEDDASFAADSEQFELAIDGKGPVSVAGKAGVELDIPDLSKYGQNFGRREIAKEWGVGKMALVPCETGVLEYGAVTKDKRMTTMGREYQETQRQYRRDVFASSDWVKHRSTERFYTTMRNLFASGVLRARYKEVATVTLFSALLALYHGLRSGLKGITGAHHAPIFPWLPLIQLPLTYHNLLAPSLGLLLVFRTNACYARWDDSRKVWGSIINKCRSVVRQANTFFGEPDPKTRHGNFRDERRRVSAETSAFTRCLRCFLRGEVDAPRLEAELKELGFTPDEVAGYMQAGNRQVYAIAQLGRTIRRAQMEPIARSRMDESLSLLTDDIGASERIFKTPIPRVYTSHLSRFVGVWVFTLPLAIVGIDKSWNRLVSVVASALITFFLIGIEELGLQIEEPFSILPIESYCDASIGAPMHAMVLDEDKARKQEKTSQPSTKLTGSVRPSDLRFVQPLSSGELSEGDTTDKMSPFSDEWVQSIRRS